MANHYDVGDTIRLVGTFTDPINSDVATDPTEVTLTVTDPSGNSDSYTYDGGAGDVAKDSTGIYHYDLAIDEAGIWTYRFVGTGTCACGGIETFRARPAS